MESLKRVAFLLVFVIFALVGFKLYLNERKINDLETSLSTSRGNVNVLLSEIRKRTDKSLETSERAAELEKSAEEEKNKGGFVWDSPLPRDSLTLQLRSN